MRFIWTFIWSFFLMQMASYVIGAMTGTTYDFVQATMLSVVMSVLVIVISAVLPNEPVEQHH
ncbi:YjzD family protein [Ectobacillus panaciterrae]|uniref:YjzD family protein n=1 Tax=Ectobacillus panaciterrae TaxID=363872 RepID=UPI000405266C|nr:YjzD family protein [Ectobacillus panaciterrae]